MRELLESFDDDRPDWLAFTSSRGVEVVVDAIGADSLAKWQGKKKIRLAAIGPSTAKTIEHFELKADLVADEPDREGLLQAIADVGPIKK
jgi:uroporphyrinogen-III synthase